MPTLDWLNRADAFTTAAGAPYRLLQVFEEASGHNPRQPNRPGAALQRP